MSVVIGTKQLRLNKINESLPSQLTGSSLKETPSECLIRIVYLVISDPLSDGAVHKIIIFCALLIVDGAAGYSGAIA